MVEKFLLTCLRRTWRRPWLWWWEVRVHCWRWCGTRDWSGKSDRCRRRRPRIQMVQLWYTWRFSLDMIGWSCLESHGNQTPRFSGIWTDPSGCSLRFFRFWPLFSRSEKPGLRWLVGCLNLLGMSRSRDRSSAFLERLWGQMMMMMMMMIPSLCFQRVRGGGRWSFVVSAINDQGF